MDSAKGTRDFPPEVQLVREDLFEKIVLSFQRHGFAPFASSAIQRKEALHFKFSGDEDVMHELFEFQDRGERDLGLRFDLTVPLARFVAENKDLKLPFKRYEIGRCYRDGPIKLGRYREFWQCDADIVGSSSMLADAECIKLACDVLSQLPFGYVLKINSRKLLFAILDHLDVKEKEKAVTIIDKLAKQGREAVEEMLSEFLSKEQVSSLLDIIIVEGTSAGRLKHVEDAIGPCEPITKMQELLAYLEDLAHVEFDPSLARGLNYYTGTVYEGFLLENKVTSSVCAGGRYDNIIGQMRGSDDLPAVGISFGVEPLTDALLAEKHRFDRTKTVVYVVPIRQEAMAARIADKLRAQGINTDLDVMGRSISKNLDFASKQGIPLVMIVGEKDLAAQQVTVKNMGTGDESGVPLADLDQFDIDSYL